LLHRFLFDLPIFYPTCDSFSLQEAGVRGFVRGAMGSTFFGAGCALHQDFWTQLFLTDEASPSPPPPPLTPFDALRALAPIRIFFNGGLSAETRRGEGLTIDSRQRRQLQTTVETHKFITAENNPTVIAHCTDGASRTACAGAATESGWIMCAATQYEPIHDDYARISHNHTSVGTTLVNPCTSLRSRLSPSSPTRRCPRSHLLPRLHVRLHHRHFRRHRRLFRRLRCHPRHPYLHRIVSSRAKIRAS